MADIQEILSSISDEDMARLKSVAQDVLNGNKSLSSSPTQNEEINAKSISSLGFDDRSMGKIMEIIGKLNKEDSRTRLINDLKPLLSESRQKKADDAIRFLQLMEMLPLLKGMF